MLINTEYMTSTEVREYLHVSQSVLTGLENKGILKPRRIIPTNHKKLYAKEDVLKFDESTKTH